LSQLKTIVGDDDARLEEAIRDGRARSKICDHDRRARPTEDDVTRKVAARALGRRLSLMNHPGGTTTKVLSFGQPDARTNSATGDGD